MPSVALLAVLSCGSAFGLGLDVMAMAAQWLPVGAIPEAVRRHVYWRDVVELSGQHGLALALMLCAEWVLGEEAEARALVAVATAVSACLGCAHDSIIRSRRTVQ